MRPDAEFRSLFGECIRCSFCQPVCPLFAELHQEGVLARAKVYMAKEFAGGNLRASPRLKELFSLCLDCRACEEVCPAHIPVHAIVAEIRGLLKDVAGSHKALYKTARFVLTRPALYKPGFRLARWAGMLQKAGPAKLRISDKREQGASGVCTLKSSPSNPEKPAGKQSIGYFAGCANSFLFAEISGASLKVLRNNGYTVLAPAETVCCGLPLYNAGEQQAAKILAGKVIRQFDKQELDVIVTACAGCSLHMKQYIKLWPDLDGAAEFSAKIQDISSFIISHALSGGPGEVWKKVTYHSPCHLGRAQGIRDEARQILGMVPGLELVEMSESERCCGGSGLFAFTHPNLSRRILDRKLVNIQDTGAAVVSTSCPSCRMQLEPGVQELGLERVVHPVQLLAQTWPDD